MRRRQPATWRHSAIKIRAYDLSFAARGSLIGFRPKSDAETFPFLSHNGGDLTAGSIGDVVITIAAKYESRGLAMIVTVLVLGAVLLSILGLMASFVTQQRVRALDQSSIATVAQLDAAIAIQRSMRIAELQRRMTDRNYWSYALLGLAFLMQIVALAVDHLAHPSIAGISIVPTFFVVATALASRRRYAQRQLEPHLRGEQSSRVIL